MESATALPLQSLPRQRDANALQSVSRTPPRGAVDGRVGVVISRDLNRGEIIDISSYFFCRFHQRPTHTKSQPALAALSKPCSGLISSPMSARAGARAAGAHPLPTQQKNSSSIANFCRWPGAAKCCGGRAPLRISFRPSARKKARLLLLEAVFLQTKNILALPN